MSTHDTVFLEVQSMKSLHAHFSPIPISPVFQGGHHLAYASRASGCQQSAAP